MPTYTFTATAEQDAALTDLRKQANATGGGYPDNQAFIVARVRDLLAPYIAATVEARLHAVADAYRNTTTSEDQRVAAEKALGL